VSALAVGSCASDPTGDLSGGVAGVEASVSYLQVTVGDSVVVVAQTRDAQGNALTTLPEVASLDLSIATVVVADQAPLAQRRFFVKGESFGATKVLVTTGAFTDTIDIQTYPKKVEITGAPDTLASGATAQLGYVSTSATGDTIVVDGTFEWESSDETIIAVDENGLLAGKAPGRATITVTAPGGAEGTVDVDVAPGTFTGTVSASAGDFGDVLVVKPGAPAWDGDEVVTIGGVEPWILGATTDSIAMFVPDAGTGAQEILITNQGPDQVASAAPFTVNTDYSQNDDPATAPNITAGPYPQEFYISVENDAPDDFFTFAPGAGLAVTVTLEWQVDADIDILWYDFALDRFVGNFTGATGANPEVSSVTVPAGGLWTLWINKFDTDAGPTMIKVTITSP
jgi:hypothetical protein